MQPDDDPQARAAAVTEALDRSDRSAQEEDLRRTKDVDERLSDALYRARAGLHTD